MSITSRRWTLAALIALWAAGFLIPLWPLSVLGVVLVALLGRWFLALLLGLVLDLAWGAPPGMLHFLLFPMTLCAILAALVRLVASKYFISAGPPERL